MIALHTILLAEDDINEAERTCEALRCARLANEIIVVHDGLAVLDCLRGCGLFAERRPTGSPVVVMDLHLPRMSGLDVLSEIRADPVLCHLPVVIVTSCREDRDLIRSYELGLNAYVVKPVDFAGFVGAIGELGVYWGVVNGPPPSHVDDATPPARHLS